MPPDTAAALPPDDPPGVRSMSQGLWVTPLSTVRVRFTPPNSDAVVSPTGTVPAARSRSMWVSVKDAISSLRTTHASVSGHPST